MITVSTAGCVALLAAALLLLPAGAGHMRHRSVFAATLRRHRVLARPAIDLIARVLGPVELTLGTAVLMAWGLGAPTWPAGLATVLLYAGFGLYTMRAVRTAPGDPCACFGAGEPLTWAIPARAAALGLGSLPALTAAPPGGAVARLGVAGAAVIVALLAWVIPVIAGSGTPASRATRP